MTTPDTRDATLPDSLNNFYARFDRLNTDTPSKAPCDSMDTAFQITHAQVLRALKQVKPHKEQLVDQNNVDHSGVERGDHGDG
ncbi:unnamed protein product [Gadus morhua 'NCC']